ncbi:MAG: sigma factor-like helix-turn-helix DNA-binding protein, partial [Bacteroidota bacterium]
QTPSPEIALDIHYLLKAMDRLPEKQKEAILLFEVSGFSIREISELQESTESATKTRLSRARKELRRRMSEKRPASQLSETMASFVSILL